MNEIAGVGNHYTAKYWEQDPRTGRRWNKDPKNNSWESEYSTLGNSPIMNIDPAGDRAFLYYSDYVAFAQKNKIEVLSEDDIWRQGHWLNEDVQYNLFDFGKPTFNNRYLNALRVNTQNTASEEYTNLNERREYYDASERLMEAAGFGVKWMGAAAKTVGTLNWALSPGAEWIGKSNEEIRVFINEGNKAILDDMMPRIKALSNMRPLRGAEARKWDMQTLSDEQSVIQAYYTKLSSNSIAILQKNLESFYNFKGNVMNPADRWSLGMKMMGYQGMTPDKMPAPNGNTSGNPATTKPPAPAKTPTPNMESYYDTH